MDLERERGITIKAQTAALRYTARDGTTYNLNLIDTPGHVDFSYEVSRSLAACEGALLVVDASQGVEAQTVANCYTAIEQGVEVVPVLNKIDLPSANPERAIQEIEDVIGIPAQDAIRASAKTGEGVDDILEAVIQRIPAPRGDPAAPLKALIIDSWFDNYVGVVMLVRVVDGMLRPKDKILLMSTGRVASVRAGRRVHAQVAEPRRARRRGGGLRHRRHQGTAGGAGRGHHDARRAARRAALPGFKEIKPQVFAGLYPVESNQYEALRDALEKLKLNDCLAALRAGSLAGARFRLPLRLPRPAAHGHRAGAARARVRHGAHHHRADGGLRGAAARRRDGPRSRTRRSCPIRRRSRRSASRSSRPRSSCRRSTSAPVITLCNQKRGVQKNMQYVGRQVMLTYEMPLNEVVMDFFDKLKSVSRGYASLDYEFKEYPRRPTW